MKIQQLKHGMCEYLSIFYDDDKRTEYIHRNDILLRMHIGKNRNTSNDLFQYKRKVLIERIKKEPQL